MPLNNFTKPESDTVKKLDLKTTKYFWLFVIIINSMGPTHLRGRSIWSSGHTRKEICPIKILCQVCDHSNLNIEQYNCNALGDDQSK